MKMMWSMGLALGLVAGSVSAQSVTPPTDPPVPAGQGAELVPSLRGQHPRLLFTAEDIPALRAKAQGVGKPFFDQLLEYLPTCNPPQDTKYLTDATDAQRQGLWRLPTVALHYVLTGDRKSLDRSTAFLQAFIEQEHWETGGEQDSGMGAANIMIGVALAYDWLYHDLDPALRQRVADKLLLQARRLYHGGHLKKQGKSHYWQNDAQNNHRWHRDGGLALAALAVAGDVEGAEWLLSRTKEELEFIYTWLPDDGTSHESATYLVFGAPHLVLAFDAADRCLGTDLLGHPFFESTPRFRLHTLTPGFGDSMHYGDSAGSGHIHSYTFRAASRHKLADEQAAFMDFYRAEPDRFTYGWFSLVWFDPSLSGGSIDNVDRSAFFPDLGLAAVRDGWAKENVAMLFKAGPYGGMKLNEYRNANNFHYINVAHDDPDANMFELFAKGGFVAEDDRYASKAKLTSSHNTILVNGKGQKGEGRGWTQPLKGPDQDMTQLAWVTAWKDGGGVVAVEGEAAGAYEGLDRYRRTVVWVEGQYILILDDIAAEAESDLTWLMQAKVAEVLETTADAMRGRIGHDGFVCGLQVVSDGAFTAAVAPSTAMHRDKSLGFQQFQLRAKTPRWRLATVIDPWNRQPKLTLAREGEALRIGVQTRDGADAWTWAPPAGAKAASDLRGRLSDGQAFSLD